MENRLVTQEIKRTEHAAAQWTEPELMKQAPGKVREQGRTEVRQEASTDVRRATVKVTEQTPVGLTARAGLRDQPNETI